jgi:hypothetical protein
MAYINHIGGRAKFLLQAVNRKSSNFWAHFRNRKSANFPGVQVLKSEICNIVRLIRKSQTCKFLTCASPILANPKMFHQTKPFLKIDIFSALSWQKHLKNGYSVIRQVFFYLGLIQIQSILRLYL